jgi:nucleoid-associated protein YgaU
MIEEARRWFKHLIDQDEHEVVKGESLSAIAKDVTGDETRWTELRDANPDKHWTADYMIQPGDKLKLPESWL